MSVAVKVGKIAHPIEMELFQVTQWHPVISKFEMIQQVKAPSLLVYQPPSALIHRPTEHSLVAIAVVSADDQRRDHK